MGLLDGLRRLLGGGTAGAEPPPDRTAAVEHKGFRIIPTPKRQAGGSFLTAGIIERDFPDGTRTHAFIRADTHASEEEARSFSVTKAKQIIDSGKLGRIFHYRANFLQDWTISEDLPQGGNALWRLDVAAAGSGVTGDLLAHCIDTAIWLNGSISDVTAMTETFIKERVHTATGKKQKVGIDDACAFLCHFANGSLGLFESTRYARGHKALYTLEINGEFASLRWDLHDLHRLELFDHRDESRLRGWRSIHVTDHSGEHPYMNKWWVPGLQIGYEHTFVHQVADFLASLEKGEPCHPTFRDSLETQKVCDAVLASAADHTWHKV